MTEESLDLKKEDKLLIQCERCKSWWETKNYEEIEVESLKLMECPICRT